MTKIDFSAFIAKGKANAAAKAQAEADNTDPLLNASQLAVGPAQPESKRNREVREYVTGQTDKKPGKIALNFPKPKPKADLSSLLRNKTASTESATSGKRDILHGSGLQKRDIERSANKLAKLAQNVTHLDEQLAEDAAAKLEGKCSPCKPDVQITLPHERKLADGIELDEFQTAAVNGVLNQKFACIIGSAGTGKTTSEKALLSAIEKHVPMIDINDAMPESQRGATQHAPAIAFCAFTGRAVQQMKRAIPEAYHRTCMTIHALLGFMPVYEPVEDKKTGEVKNQLRFEPTFTKYNKLPYKIIFMDESGMTPIPLWNQLLDALTDDCRIVLIGDINQLPPVQGRSVLGFAMLRWPTFTLEKIHRQAADNPIIANAHRILGGMFPKADPKRFAILTLNGGSIDTYNKTLAIVKKLHQQGHFDPYRDGFIVPQNVGTIGQTAFNEKLVHYFNPPRKEDGLLVNHRQVIIGATKAAAFAVGDKIMLLKNDRPRGLTNGMTGIVVEIAVNGNYRGREMAALQDSSKFDDDLALANLEDDLASAHQEAPDEEEAKQQASHIVTVQFGETKVDFSSRGDFANIAHAYAFTCHKSQGGEYPNVIILCHSANIKMLSREWLYTAVTRAQERVILICNNRGLEQAINTQRIRGNTVEEKARSFLALQDQKDTNVPNLPEPMEI